MENENVGSGLAGILILAGMVAFFASSAVAQVNVGNLPVQGCSAPVHVKS